MGRQTGDQRPRHRVGPGSERHVWTADILDRPRSASEKAGASRSRLATLRRGLAKGTKLRRPVWCHSSLMRPWTMDSACICARRLRDFGQKSGHHAGAGDRSRGPRPAAREGHRQHHDRRRRRPPLEVDYIAKAVRITQKVIPPVDLMSTPRKILGGALPALLFRPLRREACRTPRLTAWSRTMAGRRSSLAGRLRPSQGPRSGAVKGAVDFPYDSTKPSHRIVQAEPPGVPTCFWRSVGPGHRYFRHRKLRRRTRACRRGGFGRLPPSSYSRRKPHLLACLDLAAEKADWGSALPPARSAAASVPKRVRLRLVAAIAEVESTTTARSRSAHDGGGRLQGPLDPDSVEAQIPGGSRRAHRRPLR